MASWSWNLVDNLSEGIHKINHNYEHNMKNCKTFGFKYKYCEYRLGYTNGKNNLIERTACVARKITRKLLIKILNRYFLIYTNFQDINNLFYCCARWIHHMNLCMIWKNPVKHHYLKKDMEDITDADYTHAKYL